MLWNRFVMAAFAVAVLLASPVFAQAPPDIGRWAANHSVVFTPPQGFAMGNPMTLSWSIVNDGLAIDSNAPSNLRAFFNGIYGNESVWIPHFQSSFDRWSQISGLSYVYQPTDSGGWGQSGQLGVRGDIRIGGRSLGSGSSTLAYNYYPGSGLGGDMVFNTGSSWYANGSGTNNNSRGLRNVIAHEHGHGMGMPHLDSNNSNQLMEPFINLAFDGPQHHDILMAQRGYGDAYEKTFGQLGNDVVARASHLGSLNFGDSVSVGESARSFVVAPTATDFVSIDDASDIDFWSFSVNSAGVADVMLEALGFTYNAGPQNGNQISVNTRQRSNLALSLFDTDGTTQLAFSDQTGFGGNESISFLLDSAGTYFVRVTGVNNPDSWAVKTQFYSLSVGFAAIPEPSAAFLTIGMAGALVIRRRKR